MFSKIRSRGSELENRSEILGDIFSPRFTSVYGNKTLSCDGVYNRTVYHEQVDPCTAASMPVFFSRAKRVYLPQPLPRIPKVHDVTVLESDTRPDVIEPQACELNYALSLASNGVRQLVQTNITSEVEEALRICFYLTNPFNENKFATFMFLTTSMMVLSLSIFYLARNSDEEREQPIIEEVVEAGEPDGEVDQRAEGVAPQEEEGRHSPSV